MKKIILNLIVFYKRYLSFDSGAMKIFSFSGKTCRFFPTCSEYTYEAVNNYGIILGVYKGLRRILRCNPFNNGGFDPLN